MMRLRLSCRLSPPPLNPSIQTPSSPLPSSLSLCFHSTAFTSRRIMTDWLPPPIPLSAQPRSHTLTPPLTHVTARVAHFTLLDAACLLPPLSLPFALTRLVNSSLSYFTSAVALHCSLSMPMSMPMSHFAEWELSYLHSLSSHAVCATLPLMTE